jgi:hypothetical protein
MSKSRAPVRSPEQQQQAPAQQSQGPQSEEMVEADQMGNAAMQEKAGQGGGEVESQGWFDDALEGVEGAIDAVIDWTWEQIGTASDLLTYADEVGLEAAMAMVDQLVAYAPTVLEELLSTASEVDELVWYAFEALKSVQVLFLLPGTQMGMLLAESMLRGASWVIEQLEQLDVAQLKRLLQELSEADLEQLLGSSEALALKALDACWEPGLGVTLTCAIEGDVKLFMGGGEAQITVRHLGGGDFETVRMVHPKAGIGPDIDELKTVEGKLTFGVDGWVSETFAFPATGFPSVGMIARAALLGTMSDLPAMLSESLNYVLIQPFLTKWEMGGGARLEAGGGASADDKNSPESAVFELAAAVGGDVTLCSEKLDEGSLITLTGSLSALNDVAAAVSVKWAKDVFLTLGSDNLDFGSGGELELSFELHEGLVVSNVAVVVMSEVVAGPNTIKGGVELGVEEMPESVEEFLAELASIEIEATCGASGAVAMAWLEQVDLLAELGGGSWSLSAETTLSISLDTEAAQFIGQAVAEALRSQTGEEGLLQALAKWAMAPTEHTPPVVMDLLTAELAMATDMELVLAGEATQGIGGGLILEGEASVTLDIEKDLLELGATVTVSQLKEIFAGVSGSRDVVLGE